MPKKSMMEKFKAFVEASPESNEPMTKGEIATAMARKKSEGAAKRPARAASKLKAKKAVKKKRAGQRS